MPETGLRDYKYTLLVDLWKAEQQREKVTGTAVHDLFDQAKQWAADIAAQRRGTVIRSRRPTDRGPFISTKSVEEYEAEADQECHQASGGAADLPWF